MGDFGAVPANQALTRFVEVGASAITRAGGPAPADAVLGPVLLPAVTLTTDTQILSGRIVAPPGWDTTLDITMQIAFALNGAAINLDELHLDFEYIMAAPGVAADADLGKAVTALGPSKILTTAEGLVDITAYALAFTLDRDDATNPYAGAIGGGFAFNFHLDSVAGDLSTVHIASVGITFPVNF